MKAICFFKKDGHATIVLEPKDCRFDVQVDKDVVYDGDVYSSFHCIDDFRKHMEDDDVDSKES